MPTESAFFFAGLLFIAAAMGYLFARYGESDDDADAEARQADYLRGFRHLIREESDRAVEVFSAIQELDADTLDTHLALGALFRKRGEIERAIAVHENLLERGQLGKLQRHQAELALADDYLAAGVYDRAEQLLQPLAGVPELRIEALSRLLRIAEQAREWEQAVEYSRQLETAPGSNTRQAQYYCELAEQALARDDAPAARQWLEQAERAGHTVRTLWLSARLAAKAGEDAEAVRLYRRVISREPEYIVDLLPALVAASARAGLERDLENLVDELCQADPRWQSAIATAALIDPGLDDPIVTECLQEFLLQDPLFGELIDAERLRKDKTGAQLANIRAALHKLGRNTMRYRCRECGYASSSLQWQCPGCRTWESVRPLTRIAVDQARGLS